MGYNAWGHRRVRHNLVTKQLKQHFTVDIVILILLMKNLRFREDEKLGQIYTVSGRGGIWPGCLVPRLEASLEEQSWKHPPGALRPRGGSRPPISLTLPEALEQGAFKTGHHIPAPHFTDHSAEAQ